MASSSKWSPRPTPFANSQSFFQEIPGHALKRRLACGPDRMRETQGGPSVMPFDRTWQPIALCRGNHSHLFFPPSTSERKDERERREVRAKSICKVCPVRRDCLDYALAIREPYGIWGGLTEIERRQQLTRSAV